MTQPVPLRGEKLMWSGSRVTMLQTNIFVKSFSKITNNDDADLEARVHVLKNRFVQNLTPVEKMKFQTLSR